MHHLISSAQLLLLVVTLLLNGCTPLIRPIPPTTQAGLTLTPTVAAAAPGAGGTIEGRVTWLIGDEQLPIPEATIELHAIVEGKTHFLTATLTDQDGQFIFETIKAGEYMLPVVLWGSRDTDGPCPKGRPWAVIGSWLDTQAAEFGIKELFASGMTVDQTGMRAEVTKARQQGFDWVAFLLAGNRFDLAEAAVVQQEIQFECR
ncbi:MAG: carboxypeptidase regulatory-like domain-containing protein [Caldilinea sp. CFX5]|nr:carboxypeptidase regulatory-like domain-containing protein [Caldilinea sp. CFX5]